MAACAVDGLDHGCDVRRASDPDVRVKVHRFADREAARTSHPTGREATALSSLAALRSKPPLPRRSHPVERYVARIGSNGTAPAATPAGKASLRRTSQSPAAWCGRGCAWSAQRSSQWSRYAWASSRLSKRLPSAVSSAHGRRRTRPCLYDPDRAPGMACCHAIVSQNIAIQGIQTWIVDVGRQHGFAQVVGNHDPRRTAQTSKRPSRAARPTPAHSIETPKTEPTCDCSPASEQTAVCAGICRCQGPARSDLCRIPGTLLPASSRWPLALRATPLRAACAPIAEHSNSRLRTRAYRPDPARMPIALRPRDSSNSISSRYASLVPVVPLAHCFGNVTSGKKPGDHLYGRF